MCGAYDRGVHLTQAEISGILLFFIVATHRQRFRCTRTDLGLTLTVQEPADEPFFAIVRRRGAITVLKSVGVDPLPNYKREPAAGLDAWHVPDPDALAGGIASRNAEFFERIEGHR
jgi:hypothetical protein